MKAHSSSFAILPAKLNRATVPVTTTLRLIAWSIRQGDGARQAVSVPALGSVFVTFEVIEFVRLRAAADSARMPQIDRPIDGNLSNDG